MIALGGRGQEARQREPAGFDFVAINNQRPGAR